MNVIKNKSGGCRDWIWANFVPTVLAYSFRREKRSRPWKRVWFELGSWRGGGGGTPPWNRKQKKRRNRRMCSEYGLLAVLNPSPVTLPLTQIAKVIWEGDACIARVLEIEMPKTRECPHHCNSPFFASVLSRISKDLRNLEQVVGREAALSKEQ